MTMFSDATARRLLSMGAEVIVSARSSEKLKRNPFIVDALCVANI